MVKKENNMSLSKLISKSALLLLTMVTLAAFNSNINAESEADALEHSEAENNVVAQLEDNLPQDTENVTTEEVSENTDELIGQTVTIRSDALEVIEPASFTVGDESFFGGEDILIINASGETFELPADDTEVQATGEVANFVFCRCRIRIRSWFRPRTLS